MASLISAGTTSGTALNMSGDTSGVLQLATNGTTTALTLDVSQNATFAGSVKTNTLTSAASTALTLQSAGTTAVTIDTSQNVGIGTTNPDFGSYGAGEKILGISNPTSGTRARLSFQNLSTGTSGISGTLAFFNASTILGTIDVGADGATNKGYYAFYTNNGTSNSERVRIDSSGNLLVARSSAWTTNTSDNTTGFGILASSGQTLVNATGSINALIVNNTNTNNRLVSFRSANTEVGGVTITSSTATFNGTSDSRLKEDLGVSTDTSIIDNTIIHDFKWTRDGTQGKGVFAQEAYEVYPLAVSKGSDELNESGNLANPWQVNYSQYIPDLIVYCQQLKKIVDTQAETINALTARIVALEAK